MDRNFVKAQSKFKGLPLARKIGVSRKFSDMLMDEAQEAAIRKAVEKKVGRKISDEEWATQVVAMARIVVGT